MSSDGIVISLNETLADLRFCLYMESFNLPQLFLATCFLCVGLSCLFALKLLSHYDFEWHRNLGQRMRQKSEVSLPAVRLLYIYVAPTFQVVVFSGKLGR